MHVNKIIDITRSYVDEPSADASPYGDYTDDELLDFVNMEHKHLFSKIRTYYEDYHGKIHVFALTASTYAYYLPMDCVNPRQLELIASTSVSGTSPNFVVDEETADSQEVSEVLLGNKSTVKRYISNKSYGSGYYIYDDQIHFEPNTAIGSSYYGRLYYLNSAPSLHRGVVTGVTSSTFTLADDTLSSCIGDVSIVDNYYKNMRVEIISGTGKGQLRRIVKYAGDTKIATLDTNWTTNPNTSSVYGITSPIPTDYHEMLALGAVFRAKGIKVEDDVSAAGVIYQALMTDMTNNLEKRNLQHNRSVRRTRGRELWF